MSTLHHLQPAARAPKPTAKSAKRRRMTDAQIARALRNAHTAGLTVYSFSIETTLDGEVLHVWTRPGAATPAAQQSDVEEWFDARS